MLGNVSGGNLLELVALVVVIVVIVVIVRVVRNTATKPPAAPNSSDSIVEPLPLRGHLSGIALASIIVVWFSSVAGLVLGHVALWRIRDTGEDGRGLALTAVIVGWVLTALSIIVIAVSLSLRAPTY